MNIYKKIALSLVIITSAQMQSQTEAEKKEIIKSYKTSEVLKTKNLVKDFVAEKHLQIENMIQKGFPLNKIINGKKYTLIGAYDGEPIYQTAYSLDATISTRANFLHENGGLGLNIEGQNMQVGVWDGGRALKSHIEYEDNNGNSRIILGDATPFTENDTDSHGTHVTGIIASRGVNNNALGAAPEVTILSYNWDNDENEVESEAITNGLLISNHSYGVPVQDDNGNQTATWVMGCYSTTSAVWDQITYASPYYLPVLSAGNDGNTSYNGGLKNGFDKLTGNKVSKNTMVVGNGQDASINSNGDLNFPTFINSSSSQGPTDDGRIKPDVIGNGTQVFSTLNGSDTDYGNRTGTSMSSPNVAGTLILLQQYYNNLNGSFMWASTLKALTCHTADDLGNAGPDARYGWGLVNAKRAAVVIESDNNGGSTIDEVILQNNNSYILGNIYKSNDASDPLKFTIAWTDPSGSAKNGQVNSPTPALVNDLDIKVKNLNTNQEYLPFKLSLSDVSAPAINGDNTVDNIESIIIENANSTDEYQITISHKGTLQNGAQNFSLIVTGNANNISTEELNKENITIWPNPIKKDGMLHIDLKDLSSSSVEVSLIDIQGRKVYSDSYTNVNNKVSIDTRSLQSGMYILNISNGQDSIQKKIIKE